jgi:hypothetical protein
MMLKLLITATFCWFHVTYCANISSEECENGFYRHRHRSCLPCQEEKTAYFGSNLMVSICGAFLWGVGGGVGPVAAKGRGRRVRS